MKPRNKVAIGKVECVRLSLNAHVEHEIHATVAVRDLGVLHFFMPLPTGEIQVVVTGMEQCRQDEHFMKLYRMLSTGRIPGGGTAARLTDFNHTSEPLALRAHNTLIKAALGHYSAFGSKSNDKFASSVQATLKGLILKTLTIEAEAGRTPRKRPHP